MRLCKSCGESLTGYGRALYCSKCRILEVRPKVRGQCVLCGELLQSFRGKYCGSCKPVIKRATDRRYREKVRKNVIDSVQPLSDDRLFEILQPIKKKVSFLLKLKKFLRM